MANETTYHINPAPSGVWTLETGEGPTPAIVCPTEGLAVAKAWELASGREAVEVLVHGPDGAIQASLIIKRALRPSFDSLNQRVVPGVLEEEEILRREAERITPSRAELDMLIDGPQASTIDYSREDPELPC